MVGMNKEKFIIISLLALSVFAIYRFGIWGTSSLAMIRLNEEREFSKSIDIVWNGEIISTMAGGSCIGLKGGFDKYDFAMACLPDNDPRDLWQFEGVVKITGRWLGITCAYKDTIFGECVPDVDIEKIEQGF